MAAPSGKVLSVDEETALLHPIDEYVSNIQHKIDELRADGTSRVVEPRRASTSPRTTTF